MDTAGFRMGCVGFYRPPDKGSGSLIEAPFPVSDGPLPVCDVTFLVCDVLSLSATALCPSATALGVSAGLLDGLYARLGVKAVRFCD